MKYLYLLLHDNICLYSPFYFIFIYFLGEDKNIDHLVFVVHGIGPFADIRLNSFRSLIECGNEREEEGGN